ncbi:MAG: hypothetical protein II776_02160 [Clostridia bacterium]|nr:hypothetical protein [Clostridia bacterium]
MRKIAVLDRTLPKLAGTRDIPLLAREKIALAQQIEGLGVDAVELPAVRSFKEDTIVHKTIVAALGDVEVMVPAGDTEESVEQAFEGIKEAARPVLVVSLPVSTVQMEYRYHVKDAKMIEKIASLTSKAKKKGCRVYFAAEDATRAAAGFLKTALRTAVENGADGVILCDDAGTFLPEKLMETVTMVKGAVNTPVFVSLSDGIGCACANAVAAVRAGADGVFCAVTGEDSLLTGDLAAALTALGEEIGVESGLKQTEIHSDISFMLKKMTRTDPGPRATEEGRDVFLDGSSAPDQVDAAARSLGYDLSADDLGKVCEALARVCEKKSSIGAKELEAVIASTAMQVPSTFHLTSYQTTSSNLTAAMASVTLTRSDETLCGVATGDGPIDSSFKAIEQIVGHHYELDEFQIQAVTEGKEALGSALVRLRSQGRLYSGNGLSTDIVGASIRAYINALNKIVYEEKER